MAIAPRLELRQGQSLVMTPQLRQAITLLQYSNAELAEYLEGELERNPLLERHEGGETDGAGGDPGAEAADGESAPSGEEPGPASEETAAIEAIDAPADSLWEDDGGLRGSAMGSGSGRGPEGEDGPNPDETLGERVTLRDHLIGQLAIEVGDPADRLVGLHLIGALDEAGYIEGDLGAIAAALGCDRARVERVLSLLQGFDPPGLFARTLAECLALQLRERDRLDPAMRALLDNLDLLAKRDLAELCRRCGVERDDLADMIAEIRALDPKPALAFDHSVAASVTPDVLMRPFPGGGWSVELNTEALPRVLVNNRYHARIAAGARGKDDRQFISQCYQSASWLVRALHQRATTILKVAGEIVRQQDAFFRRGVEHLRPLVLRDIALAVDLHESTVSRVTSNKYIATPRGNFELRYFFTAAIGSTVAGLTLSAESVRHRIRALVEEETEALSDDQLVEALRREGIDIARRTVAKYRESLGIASSVQRRRDRTAARWLAPPAGQARESAAKQAPQPSG